MTTDQSTKNDSIATQQYVDLEVTSSYIDIPSILPHRYPFLLIDKVIDLKQSSYSIAIKNVTRNEHFFTGHFPSMPVMPGVLILEAMAQNCIFCANGPKPTNGLSVYLTSIDKAKFIKPVVPGDVLILNSKLLKNRNNLWFFECTASVDKTLVSKSIIGAVVNNKRPL